MITRRQMLIASVASVLASKVAFAQEAYPQRPVTIIVPVAPGGLADIITRAAADRLSVRSGGSFLVDYVVGVGGSLGTQAVANADPDGYTLGLVTEALLLVNPHLYENVTYTVDDFAPVGILANMPLMILVSKDHPAQTLEELIALAKEQPGVLSYGSSGTGTMPHLVVHQLSNAAGISLVHVPYKSGANSVTDLIGGRLDVLAAGAPLVLGSIGEGGPLRPLAVTGNERLPDFPDLPTVNEAGVPDFALNNPWWGLVAPSGTPPSVIEQLNTWLALDSMTEAELELLAATKLEPSFTDAEGMAQVLETEGPVWEALVAEMGITLE